MSEMEERVAKAIFASQANARSLDKVDQLTRESVLMAARAAIEAMREPTDIMLKAGAAKWDDDWCSETNALNMWNAMCDEALK